MSQEVLDPRDTYPPSIYDTPFRSLPNPKRVWQSGETGATLGKLQLLTPTVVASAASSEIKTGRRVGLGWDLTKLEHSQFQRQSCSHKIIPLLGGHYFDDVVEFNPQQSSQWDGFRHASQPRDLNKHGIVVEDRVFFGGVTREDILKEGSKDIGIHHWAKEGIAGRAILLDYASWAAKQGIKYSTFSTHQVKLTDLLAIAKAQNTVPKKGDILLVRTGVITEWDAMSSSEKIAYSQQKSPSHCGVEATMEMLEWLWDSGFVAVAGDAISFEVYPDQGVLSLHEHLLPGWGVPIGELFDLEALAKVCEEEGRWSFFFTSMPLNMPGGISSPPNAMAIF